jgi:hypothetical protein
MHLEGNGIQYRLDMALSIFIFLEVISHGNFIEEERT